MLSGHYHKRLKRLWGSTEERISSPISSALLHLKGRPWLVVSLGSSWLQCVQPGDLEAEWSRAGMACLGGSEGSLAASFPVRGSQSSKKVSSDVLGRQQAPGVLWKRGITYRGLSLNGDCKPPVREGDAEVFPLFIDVDFHFSRKNYTLDLKILFRFSSAS